MHLWPSLASLFFATVLAPLYAQTDHPASTAPVTRAIAVYEWTGDLPHPTAARLLPVSLFINNQLEDAGIYLAQPIPFALQPGTLYLLQRAGQTGVPDGRPSPAGVETIGALNIQSAHTTPSATAPAWAAYGRFLTPTEAAAATAPIPPTTTLTLPAEATTETTPPAPSQHQKKTKQQAYVTPPANPILDDPDRPTLAAGQPSAPATPPELTTLPPDLHQSAAISDAANRAPETFAYAWPSHANHDQILQALEALALPPLTHYIAFNHLAADTHNPTLLNAHLLAYTLAADTTLTYVLTAESPLTTNGPIYLTLIAQPDANNQLHATLLNITDAAHLDRTPWLRPIDAVDPDATGRAALLFELRSQTTRQFALYTLITTPPQQTLLTTPIP